MAGKRPREDGIEVDAAPERKRARLGEPAALHKDRRLIVVLENAVLETVAMKKGYELLNCDDHQRVMKKKGRDFSLARPDIAHQSLLNLLDSPMNKAGLLQVYLRTNKNVLIEINPQTRVPRTFKRFAGLMVQLLHELRIVSSTEDGGSGTQTLLKVIKNPVTQYFPLGCRKIGTSSKGALHDIDEYLKGLPDGPVVFVIGAISKGEIEADYVDETIAYSSYPLSAALAAAKLCTAFEKHWGIL